MNGKIKYRIFNDLRLILVKYSGNITTDIIAKHIQNLTSDREYNVNFNTIADLRESNLQFKQDQLSEIIGKIIENETIIGERKQTFIIGTDEHLAMSSLFSLLVSNLPMHTSIVHSVREAIDWVGLSFSESKYIDQELIELS